MQKSKIWCIIILMLVVLCFFLIGSVTVIIDPFFHYHPPLKELVYPIYNQRYQNNGILKHFEYDAIITGTSMTENFKTSEFDKLFDVNSVKVPFSGAFFRETSERLNSAFQSDNHIKYVVQSLDYADLVADKNQLSTYTYPDYLYNHNPLDDVQYILNKTVLFEYSLYVLEFTQNNTSMTSFDEYSNWNDKASFGKEAILKLYDRPQREYVNKTLLEEEKLKIQENLEENIIAHIRNNPLTEFYLFFPPYSIVHWDRINQKGEISKAIEIYEYAAELLMVQPNVHLYTFSDNFELVCDLNNYKDTNHYGEWINSEILKWMRNDQYQLLESNYKERFAQMREFYINYDYEGIFS